MEGGYLLHVFYIWDSLFWLLEWSLNHITGLVRGVEHVLFGGEEIRVGGCGGEEFQEAPWVSQNLVHDGMEGLSCCWSHQVPAHPLREYERGSSYFPEIRSGDCHNRQQKWAGHHLEKGAPHWVSSSEMFTRRL